MIPAVSVIVAARNAERRIEGLLEALERQTLARERFEVIVVDDASTDATASVTEAHGLAHVVRLESRGGAYVARNAGLEPARGEVIAFTDSDCAPARHWLERGLAELDRLGVHLLGGRIDAELGERPTVAELIDFARGLDQERCVRQWGFAATANLFARREVFERVGRFNPALISGGDAELVLRARMAGFRLEYSPRPVVRHELRRSAREVARKGFRVGFGAGQARRLAEGPARERPRLWSSPRAWRPRHGLLGGERLLAAGYTPSRPRLVALDLGQYLFHQLPMLVGDLSATLRSGRAT